VDVGLVDLRTIINGAAGFLNRGGLLAMETGIDQHAALLVMLQTAGYADAESCRDLTGRDRFVFARKP
jgi:release factor glutamine methyltransferase